MKNPIYLRLFYLHLVMLSAIVFAGCQKNDDTPNDLPLSKGEIIFNLHVPGAFLTRATGLGDENGSSRDKIAFYQFNKEGKYEQRYVLNYAAASFVAESGNTRSYTLELTSSTGGEKRFVIVESEDENNFPSMSESNTCLLYTSDAADE